MRIAVLANAGSVHARRWSMALADRGHEVTLLGIRDASIPGVSVDQIGSGDSKVAAFASYVWLLLTARRRLRSLAPDVVHAHYATTHGVIAGLRSPAPVVLTVWGSDVMRGDRAVRRPLRWLVRLAARRATSVTSSSGAMADIVEETTGVRPTVIRFGIETVRFAGVERPPAEPFTAGFLKGLHERYGPDVLLEAWAQVTERLPEARLIMAGDGPLQAALERQADRLGLDVEFAGRIGSDDVPAFFARVHVLVNPSRTESFGVVLLEAAAAGVPTVATKVGGTAEAMQDGATGLLVPPNDGDRLAAAILRLASKPGLRDDLGRGGRAFAAGFEWSDCVDHMEEVLRAAAA